MSHPQDPHRASLPSNPTTEPKRASSQEAPRQHWSSIAPSQPFHWSHTPQPHKPFQYKLHQITVVIGSLLLVVFAIGLAVYYRTDRVMYDSLPIYVAIGASLAMCATAASFTRNSYAAAAAMVCFLLWLTGALFFLYCHSMAGYASYGYRKPLAVVLLLAVAVLSSFLAWRSSCFYHECRRNASKIIQQHVHRVVQALPPPQFVANWVQPRHPPAPKRHPSAAPAHAVTARGSVPYSQPFNSIGRTKIF